MPRDVGLRRFVMACVWGGWALCPLAPALDAGRLRADEVAAIDGDPAPVAGKYRLPTPGSGPARASGEGSGWWFGPAGIVLVLAVFGGGSLACRKFLPKDAGDAKGLRVVGRTSLSPKHMVHLVRAGDRILMIGTGPQGPPALLGEWPDSRQAGGLDARVGEDDE